MCFCNYSKPLFIAFPYVFVKWLLRMTLIVWLIGPKNNNRLCSIFSPWSVTLLLKKQGSACPAGGRCLFRHHQHGDCLGGKLEVWNSWPCNDTGVPYPIFDIFNRPTLKSLRGSAFYTTITQNQLQQWIQCRHHWRHQGDSPGLTPIGMYTDTHRQPSGPGGHRQ